MVLLTVVDIVYLVVAVGLSLLAGYLLQAKQKDLARDDKPSTTATRGTYIPWLLGIRRVGAIVSAVGNRVIRSESPPGGKGLFGGGGSKVDVYYEDGVHLLASNGPMYALHRIQQQGKIIFEGPITRDSHPSGTGVDLGKEGSFTIYWGEEEQPVNTSLTSLLGVVWGSSWPFNCYIHWHAKLLGTSPNWALLDYTLESRCEFSDSILTSTVSYRGPSLVLDGPTFPIYSHFNASEGGGGHFTIVMSAEAALLGPNDHIRLTGNSMPDQDLIIKKVQQVTVLLTNYVDVYPYGGVTAANDSGSIQLYSSSNDDGLNHAHCIAEMLFAPWPRGIAQNQADWNINGGGYDLESLGILCQSEGLYASLLAQNGDTVKAVLGGILQDIGVMVPLNSHTGKIDFVPIRDSDPYTLPLIKLDMQTEALPEIESQQGERAVDKLTFSFSDRANYWRDMTIALAADGQASFSEHQRARKVDIVSTVNFDTAARIAERRSQEELAGGAIYRWKANRGVRELMPGTACRLEGVDEVLRLTSVGIDPDHASVELVAMSDFMGAAESTYDRATILPFAGGEPEPDLLFTAVEVPAYLLTPGDPITLVVPRIRAHSGIASSTVWISNDDITYYPQGADTHPAAGGTLLDPLTSRASQREPLIGPTISILGPDIGTVLDLSGDPTSWRAGRQLCVIVSAAGSEVCYLQSVTALGGLVYRLDGLIRARYDCEQLDHPAGAEVYIVPNDLSFGVRDVLLSPGVLLYVKTTPGGIPLSYVAPKTFLLHGKNVTPMDPMNMRAAGPSRTAFVYATGEAIVCTWGYRSSVPPIAGAGLGGKGNVYVAPVVQGSFILEFLTTTGTLKKQVVSSIPSYTLTNADLIAAFGLEPVAFKVRVRDVLGAYESNNIEITVKKV